MQSNRVSDVLGALSAIFETTPSDVTQAEYLAKVRWQCVKRSEQLVMQQILSTCHCIYSVYRQ
eukprot:scaffold179156_cov14-Tisochrysis_lutea.AAC.1